MQYQHQMAYQHPQQPAYGGYHDQRPPPQQYGNNQWNEGYDQRSYGYDEVNGYRGEYDQGYGRQYDDGYGGGWDNSYGQAPARQNEGHYGAQRDHGQRSQNQRPRDRQHERRPPKGPPPRQAPARDPYHQDEYDNDGARQRHHEKREKRPKQPNHEQTWNQHAPQVAPQPKSRPQGRPQVNTNVSARSEPPRTQRDRLQADQSSYPEAYGESGRRSFERGPAEPRGQGRNEPATHHGPPQIDRRNMQRSPTTPQLSSWDNPFPSFPGMEEKKRSRQVEPETLNKAMASMEVEDAQQKQAPAPTTRPPNPRSHSDKTYGEYDRRGQQHGAALKQRPHQRGMSIDYGDANGSTWQPQTSAPVPAPRGPPERDERQPQAPHRAFRGQFQPEPSYQTNPGQLGVPEPYTAPVTPQKNSFEIEDQRRPATGNAGRHPAKTSSSRKYPGQRQYAPASAGQEKGFDFHSNGQGQGDNGPGIDMPNFDAMPSNKSNGHQRGMTIDDHLKLPSAEEPPPMPNQAAMYGQAPNSDQFGAQAHRSRSQPDLRDAAKRTRPAAGPGNVGEVFEMAGDVPQEQSYPAGSQGAAGPNYHHNGRFPGYDPYAAQYDGRGPRQPHNPGRSRPPPAQNNRPRPSQSRQRQSPPKPYRVHDQNIPKPVQQQSQGYVAHPSPHDRRANSLGSEKRNPDALPQHPVPVRPGLLQGGALPQSARPPPIRQHDNPNPAPVASAPQPTRKASQASESSRRGSTSVTQEELDQAQRQARSNPQDPAAQMHLVKTLVGASSSLANDSGRADPRARSKNRERYIMDADRHLRKLVSSGYADAVFYLADSYGAGRLGLQNDPKEAFVLYQQAAKAGHAEAAYRVAVCCEIGPEGGTRMDAMKAIQWHKRSAAMGNPQAMYKMGIILLKGLLGQQPNQREAVVWLKRAADHADTDNPHALHELGLLYANAGPNESIVRDEAYARQLFMQAAELGYRASQFRLACAYEYGLMGCPIDPRQSISWYSRAAVQEDHQAELALSGWYLTGSEGVLAQNDTEAYLWARKAAQAGLAKAEYAMGYFTEAGIGAPANLEEAKRWYWRAAGQNFPKAVERLEDLRKGGPRSETARERLSRSNVHKNETECSVM